MRHFACKNSITQGKIAQLRYEYTNFQNLQVVLRLLMHEILHINFHDYVPFWHSHDNIRLHWNSK